MQPEDMELEDIERMYWEVMEGQERPSMVTMTCDICDRTYVLYDGDVDRNRVCEHLRRLVFDAA